MLRRRVFGGDRVVGLRKEYTVTGFPSSFSFDVDLERYHKYGSNTYYADFSIYEESIDDAEVDVKIDIYDVYLSGKEQFVRSEYSTITCDVCWTRFTLEYLSYSKKCRLLLGLITLYSSEEDAEIELDFYGIGDEDYDLSGDFEDIQDAVVFNIEVDNKDGQKVGTCDISVDGETAHVSVW